MVSEQEKKKIWLKIRIAREIRQLKSDLETAEKCYSELNQLIWPFLGCFFEKKKVTKHSRKIKIDRGRYCVCKKEYWYLDCVDLYIEMLILLNWELIGQCRTCTNILRWVLERIGKYLHAREFLYNVLLNNNDIYKVDDFKNDLVI